MAFQIGIGQMQMQEVLLAACILYDGNAAYAHHQYQGRSMVVSLLFAFSTTGQLYGVNHCHM